MIVTRPPMGWNSWNTFEENISDQLIRETADIMVSTGLRDAGYDYLVIDDCWSLRERGADGRIVPNPEKFPNGMKSVADYVHSKGLKFGMYSCAGGLTCASYPGSFDHEFLDADTFASWGVDFLKYDYCFHSPIMEGKVLYRRMGTALENCGRDILFSACTWGADHSEDWIKETSASMWRSTNDIHDDWEVVKSLIRQQFPLIPYQSQGCFNDMDMLVVGLHGNGGENIGSGMTDLEYRTHFSIWCLFASPLFIGCDIRNMSEATKEILLNKELIAINQDPASRQLIHLKQDFRLDAEAFARPLANGDIAIGMVNLNDHKSRSVIGLDQFGLNPGTGKTLLMHNVWTGEDIKVKNGVFVRSLEAHDCEIWRGKVVDI